MGDENTKTKELAKQVRELLQRRDAKKNRQEELRFIEALQEGNVAIHPSERTRRPSQYVEVLGFSK